MRESNYWLRIIKAVGAVEQGMTERLLNESEELKKILGAISSKFK